MKEKGRFWLLEESTTPQAHSQQVRIFFSFLFLIKDISHIQSQAQLGVFTIPE